MASGFVFAMTTSSAQLSHKKLYACRDCFIEIGMLMCFREDRPVYYIASMTRSCSILVLFLLAAFAKGLRWSLVDGYSPTWYTHTWIV